MSAAQSAAVIRATRVMVRFVTGSIQAKVPDPVAVCESSAPAHSEADRISEDRIEA